MHLLSIITFVYETQNSTGTLFISPTLKPLIADTVIP